MEDRVEPPKISISRTSTASNKNDESPMDGQRYGQPPTTSFNYDTWNPHPWRYRAQRPTWKHRMHNPELEWRIKWTKDCFPTGRVLIIDYVSATDANLSLGRGGKKHVTIAAQEFENLKSLQEFYANTQANNAALRVVHVQNCPWATGFLLRKFNIDHDSEMVGMQGFTKWARYSGPRQRNGKPFPNGRSWREQTDPWRNVSRTAFGLDYLKTFPTPDARNHRGHMFGGKPLDARMMHLNAYGDSRSPQGYDVSVQRLNVYVQRSLGPGKPISPEDQKKNPYAKHIPNGHWVKGEEGKVDMSFLDNSSTIIIFESSASMLMDDCLIQPRNELENRWRRLPFYLRKQDLRDDARLAAQCMNIILGDVFHALAISWQEFLAVGQDHVNILEDKIYENPADESRAPELWSNQAAWLKVGKVMWIHQDIIREMQGHLHDMADVDVDVDEEPESEQQQQQQSQNQLDWLSNTTAEYERLAHGVQEDLVQPTANLNDLMYKSVGIRDSRQSLQLGLSMWRLSWITFIFLPLTFIVSFFGMNVNIFAGEAGDALPDVGWYFLAAAILMIFVLCLWYCVKHSLQRRRQTPYQRGLYEDLFNKLENQYPLVWSSDGAVDNVEPDGVVNKVKWKLIRRWFAPERTINKKLYQSLVPDGSDDVDFGAWPRFKSYLLKRWLPQLRLKDRPHSDIPMGDMEAQGTSHSAPSSLHYASGTITELAKTSTPIAMADAQPTSVQQISTIGLKPLSDQTRRRSSSLEASNRRQSVGRSSSQGSSGIMVEERNLSDSESDVGEGASSSREEEGKGRRASE